jgi:ATP-dependent DNA helicase RecG
VVVDLEPISKAFRFRLEEIASAPRTKSMVDRLVLIDDMLTLCEGLFVTLRCLEELVNRKLGTLRDQYVKSPVRHQQIRFARSKTPNHERQAYTTVKPTTP